MNGNKIILDLCGGTGSWSRPYAEAGYDVRLVTLPENDIRNFSPPENVYGILAAPPCTEFSIAKGSKPRDFRGSMEIVKKCLEIVWSCRLNGSLVFWGIENPRGFLRQFLGIPHFTFEHWQYGDLQIKPTDIWGYFHEPAPLIKIKPELLTVKFGTRTNGRGWSSPPCPDEYIPLKLDRAARRSITPPGFAKAFYKANK